MFRNWMTRLTCWISGHRWVPHARYDYILSDSGEHAYQCGRCEKIRTARFPIQ